MAGAGVVRVSSRSIARSALPEAGSSGTRSMQGMHPPRAALPQALLIHSQDASVKAQLLANTQNAFEHGAFAAPSFLVGEELFFGKDKLPDVEFEILTHFS